MPAAPQPANSEATERTEQEIRLALAVTLFSTLLLSRGLWLGGDPFSAVSVGGFPSPPTFLLATIWGLLILGVLSLFRFHDKRLVLALASLFALRCVWDRLTWQPYLLQYGLMLWALAGLRAAPTMEFKERLTTLRLALVAVYFWSGFSKLHHNYLAPGNSPTFGQYFDGFPGWLQVAIAAASALGEAGLGLALLWPRHRKKAVVLLCGMHAFILFVLVSKSANFVVWPWNLLSIFLLVRLFWFHQESEWPSALARPTTMSRVAVLLLLCCAPALSYLGTWNGYLSYRLYAARNPEAYVFVTEDVKANLPESAIAHFTPRAEGGLAGYLDLAHWAESSLGVLPPTETPVFRGLAKQIADAYSRENDAGCILLIDSAPHWRSGEVESSIVPQKDL